MTQTAKVLAVIPARGGSKGLPRKNVLDTAGKPLIAWTIKAARNARCISKVVLSSDDEEIIAVAREYGCDVPFTRPADLASDDASTLDVILHALDHLHGYDYVVVLQPTSPLRSAADIDAAFDLMIANDAPSCVSVCEVQETPYWMFSLEESRRLKRLITPPKEIHRRQDLPKSYKLNGAIYIVATQVLFAENSFVSDRSVAYEMARRVSIDVDTRLDHERVEAILQG